MRFLSTDVCFFVCAFVLLACCTVFYYAHKRPQKDQSKIFQLILFNLLLTAISALIANGLTPLVSPDVNGFNILQQFFQTLYFALHTLLAPLFAVYVVLVNNWGDVRTEKTIFFFLSPAFLLEVFVLTNPFTGLIFYYENNVVFRRGILELLIYAEAAGYIFFAMQQLFTYRKMLSWSASVAFWFFIGCSFVGVAVQFIFPWCKLELFLEAISLWGVLLLIEMENLQTDPLTGVYNRQMFLAETERYLRAKRKYMVVVISLLNFKNYLRMFRNDDLEKDIKTIILWMSKNIKGTVFRIAQNKVAVVTFKDRRACDEFAARFRLMVLNQENFSNRSKLPITACVDVVRVPDEIQHPELLVELGEVDDSDGLKSGVIIHREEDIEQVCHRVELVHLLDEAIQKKSFDVYYQPIWNAEISQFDSAEALVRLFDPRFGLLSPEKFIPIAEQNGMIADIGRIVFEKVCQFLQRERPEQFGLKCVEINLSVYQLYAENTDILFRGIMEKYGISPDRINLEITESAPFRESDVVKERIDNLAKMGVSFSLDDFGTGYSNLLQLLQNDFKNIKLDKGLLWNAGAKNSDNLLIEMINIIRKLRFDVVQEGVETKDQLELVLKAGANRIQGFYFSKPICESELLEYLKVRNSAT